MSDPAAAPPAAPPPPTGPAPVPPPNRGLGWFLAISGAVVVFLTLGCVLAVSDGKPFSEDGAMGLVCGSPTLLLGGLFLWLGTRRLKR
jgi:peptidoglycan/LPS O-acetylase OafA/YrhL